MNLYKIMSLTKVKSMSFNRNGRTNKQFRISRKEMDFLALKVMKHEKTKVIYAIGIKVSYAQSQKRKLGSYP